MQKLHLPSSQWKQIVSIASPYQLFSQHHNCCIYYGKQHHQFSFYSTDKNKPTTSQEDFENIPLSDLPGDVFSKSGFKTFVPMDVKVNLPEKKPNEKLSPEDIDNILNERRKVRLQKGVEYNPFLQQQQPDPENLLGLSQDSEEQKALFREILKKQKEGDNEGARKLFREAFRNKKPSLLPNLSPEQRVAMQQKAMASRKQLEDYLEKHADKIPDNIKKEIRATLAFEQRVLKNLMEVGNNDQAKTNSIPSSTTTTTSNTANATTTTAATGFSPIHTPSTKGEEHKIHPSVRVVQFGKKGSNVLGFFVAFFIGSSIALGLAAPGFKQYVFNPMRKYFLGEVDDPDKID